MTVIERRGCDLSPIDVSTRDGALYLTSFVWPFNLERHERLATAIINLRAGGTAGFSHGLAALYLGISIIYGHKIIKWTDVRFAHRFARGPAPAKPHGWQYTSECWKDVVRTAAAVGIAAGILWLLTALVDDPGKTSALQGIYPILGIWFAIDLIWAISYTLWPKKQPAATGAKHGQSHQ